MKKILLHLIFVLLGAGIFIPSSVFAELAFNQQIGKYYSKNASMDIDQNEYHDLFCRIDEEFIQPKGIVNLYARDWAAIFGFLRVEGTPTALRLIHDFELVIKGIKDDIKRISQIV